MADSRLLDNASLPAGEVRTGFVIAAVAAVVAQFGVIGRGAASGWPALAAHAATAGLVYLLFVNLSKRKLGAPLIAAVLFAAHPAAAATLAAEHGWGEVAGSALGLLSGVLLARTPLDPRLLWPALAAYAASLPLAPGFAAIPFLVAAAIVAYHGLEPARLFGKRLLPRFAAFLVPFGAWAAWSAISGESRGFAAAARDAATITIPFSAPIDAGAGVGVAIVAALLIVGLLRLRASPKLAWPLLAASLSFVAAATLRNAWGGGASAYAPLAFAALLFAEGIEELYLRFGGAVAAPLLFVVYAALAVLSHLRAGG